MSTRKVARSSVSGRFVTREYARRYRGTTQVETVVVPKKNRSRFRAGKDLFTAEKDTRTAKGKKTGSSFKAGRDL